MVKQFTKYMNLFNSKNNFSNTFYINPSGLCEKDNFSYTSSFDVCRLLFLCANNSIMRNICSKMEAEINILRDKNNLIIPIDSTMKRFPVLSNYNILIAKTGSGDGNENLACVIKHKDKLVSCCILGADTHNCKFYDMKRLIDEAIGIIDSNKINNFNIDTCKSFCAIDLNTEKVLLSKNKDERLPSMSLNKLLTCLLVTENENILQKYLTVTKNDLKNTENTSGCLFQVNDHVTINDLLYALMLPSSNQAANILANNIKIKKI